MRISDWSSDVCSSDLSAFYGTGGFVAAYLLTSGIVPHMLGALLVGVIVAALAGLVIGYLTLRRTGIYFAMSTLAFGEMFYFLENSLFKEYTGGESGIAGVPPPEIALGFTDRKSTRLNSSH